MNSISFKKEQITSTMNGQCKVTLGFFLLSICTKVVIGNYPLGGYEHGLQLGQLGGHEHGHVEYHAPPKYQFNYAVNDPHTGDIKQHHEERNGDQVKGVYTLKESDGTTRVVEYKADKHSGFNAVVHKIGEPHHQHQIGGGIGGLQGGIGGIHGGLRENNFIQHY